MRTLLLPFFLFFFINTFAQTATFNPVAYNEYISSAFNFISTTDINGDSLTDIIGATAGYPGNNNEKKIFVWLQQSNGTLKLTVDKSYLIGGEASNLITSNLYNNGAKIITTIGNHLCIYGWDNTNKTTVLEDSFKTGNTHKQRSIAAGDFDGNGLLDIAVTKWGSPDLIVLYQNNSSKVWDLVHYVVDTGFGHYQMIPGRLGNIQSLGLIGANASKQPISIITFDASRNIDTTYNLEIPSFTSHVYSVEIVRKKAGGKELNNELWATYGGNYPRSKAAIWKSLTTMPDSIIQLIDIPETIKAANLDCTAEEEPVILHGGFGKATLITDTMSYYNIKNASHFRPNALALGDVNNDGKKDICIAGSLGNSFLQVFYNTTPPCWPVNTKDKKALLKANIYPNPTTGNVTIQLNKKVTQLTLTTTNITGQIIDKKIINNTNKVQTVIKAPCGVYFLSLKENGNVFSTFRVTKI